MARASFSIDASNLDAAKAFIRQQFDQLSWWPAQGPHQARAEFDQLPDTADALTLWCEKWLDGGQWRQLRIAVQDTPSKSSG